VRFRFAVLYVNASPNGAASDRPSFDGYLREVSDGRPVESRQRFAFARQFFNEK